MTLPKFLLAWADWSWIPIPSRLRPAKEARWSHALTLGLILLAGGLGALVGLLLALALLHRPVGWLPWLMGLWWTCIGLCRYGVTAICWNQRAALLRANPALPTALPRSRFRFGRWCLGAVYLAVLGVITPLALVVTVENIRGEIAWQRTRTRLIVAGEKLSFREILGPEIPTDQNAGAASIFAPLFDYYTDTSIPMIPDADGHYPSRLVWRQSNAVARFEYALQLPDGYLPKQPKRPDSRTPSVNLDDWSVAFRTLLVKPKLMDNVPPKKLHLPPPGNAARDVLAGLEPAEPVLSEICRAAALPRAQFPIHYDEAFYALLRHLSEMKALQRVLDLRCAAHLAAGETGHAFADATNALNVAELLREEPFLISQLVRYAQGSIALHPLWQGLADHRWNDAQLSAFQARLGQIDYLPGIVQALEGERAGGIRGLEQLISNPPLGIFEDPSLRWLKFAPRSILRQNQVALADWQSDVIADLRAKITEVPQAGLAPLVRPLGLRTKRPMPPQYSPYTALATMLAPAMDKATSKTARAQTATKLALAALALERYRLAHEEFPEKLEHLTPQFLADVPLDPMTSRPFLYKRTDDGWFQLYSVGPDGKDDGGVMWSGNKNDNEDKDWPWPVPTRPEPRRLF